MVRSIVEEDRSILAKGRLKLSNLSYNAKHPFLLTAKQPVVQFELEKAHCDNLKEGTYYVRNILLPEFWLLGLLRALRKSSQDVPNEDT